MENKKFQSLDGLRGLAALVVVLLHYVTAFAPFLIGYVVTTRHTPLDRAVSTSVLQLPVAGSFAVCIFFVLSGLVLSVSFFKHQSNSVLVSSAVRRYFRLMLPALGSVLLAYVLVRSGHIYSQTTAQLTESSNWLASFWNFQAGIGTALYQGIYGVFFSDFNTYNIVLWTMHYELFGSFLVFMFLALFGKLRNRWFFYSLLALVFLKTYYLAFILGVTLSDAIFNYPQLVERIKDWWLGVAIIPAVILGCWPTVTIYTSLYSRINIPFFDATQLPIFAHVLGALVVVLSVLRLKSLSKFFEARLLQYLGRVSFSLYLTHFVVMSSFACLIFNLLVPHVGYKLSLVLMFVPSMALTFAIAHFYTRFVDVPSINLSRQLGSLLIGETTPLDFVRRTRKSITSYRQKQPWPNQDTTVVESDTPAY